MGNKSVEERGFSLVEILVAVVLLAVGALGAVTMQRAAVQSNTVNSSRSIGTSLARQLLETAENVDYDEAALDETNGFENPPAAVSPANPLNARGETAASGYTRTWEITDGANGTPQQNLKVIRARVAWNQPGGTGQVVLTTLKAR